MDEFERMIINIVNSKLDGILDEKLNEKLSYIDNKINNLKDTDDQLYTKIDDIEKLMDTKLNNFKEINNHIDNQTDAIVAINNSIFKIVNRLNINDDNNEKDLLLTVVNYYKSKNLGTYLLLSPRFPEKIYDENNNELVNFNGVFVLTDDDNYKNYLLGANINITEIYKKPNLVLICVKQHLTMEDVKKILIQRETLMDLIFSIKNKKINMSDSLAAIHIDKMDNNVGLCIGCVYSDNDARQEMQKFIEFNKNNNLCSYVELNASKYNIKEPFEIRFEKADYRIDDKYKDYKKDSFDKTKYNSRY